MKVVSPSVSLGFYLQVLHGSGRGNAVTDTQSAAQNNGLGYRSHSAIMRVYVRQRPYGLRLE